MSPWTLLGWVAAGGLSVVILAVVLLVVVSFVRQAGRIIRGDERRTYGR